MGTLANISSQRAIRAFEQTGFFFDRKRGSHLILKRPGHRQTLAIPERKELAVGTLRTLIRDAGLTVDEFLALL